MVSGYESILRAEEEINDDVTLRKVAVVTDKIEWSQEKVIEEGLQVLPVNRLKSEYFQLYFFIIGSVATDRGPIDIIDSRVEAPLLSPG